ncbi:MAG: glycosyl hydrolase family 18 protein [Candidatus Dormibacteria bacterium]
MFTRKRTLAAAALVMVVLAGGLLGRSAQVAVQGQPAVTIDGATLQRGAREVSPRPAIGLLLPPGSTAGDFRAAIDGRTVGVRAAAGRTALLDVGALPQGSHHRLEVWRDALGPAHVGAVDIDFHVADPLQVAASWLTGGAQTTVQVSASRELADLAPIEDALSHAGASVRRDEQGIEARWPAGRLAEFTIPAGLRATTGAYLPAGFQAALGAVPAGPFSRVDLSQPASSDVAGLKLRAYFVSGPLARADLTRHAAQVSILSPSFYAAAADGSLVRNVDDVALATAHAAGIQVEPLVTNKDFSADVARELFSSRTAADGLASELISEAKKRGYAGYQLDFEGLGYGDRDHLTRFSQGLGSRLSAAGLRYSTAVVPQKQGAGTGLEQLFGHSGVYDYGALSRGAASMSLMAYDQHTSATDPGPVAGLDWVQQVATASSSGLDRSRIFLGVPLYYRDWPLHGSPSAGRYDDVIASAVAHDGTLTWDFSAQSPLVQYSPPGEEHVVWLENRASLAAKVQVARQLGFGGVAAWRLGLEDPGFWDLWPSR